MTKYKFTFVVTPQTLALNNSAIELARAIVQEASKRGWAFEADLTAVVTDNTSPLTSMIEIERIERIWLEKS